MIIKTIHVPALGVYLNAVVGPVLGYTCCLNQFEINKRNYFGKSKAQDQVSPVALELNLCFCQNILVN